MGLGVVVKLDYFGIANIRKGKLHLCILTFTLITNLTFDFEKYIPSHLKKCTLRYLNLLTAKVKKLKYPLLSEKITFKFGYSLLRVR